MKKEDLIRKLEGKGFSEQIIKAFEKVPREKFVPAEYQAYAYIDGPLPIGEGATISQPQTIAYMLEWLELKDEQKILEIGSGSGYVLALMNEIANDAEIIGLEINSSLVSKSKKVLKNSNIKIYQKSGFKGLPEKAPFDRILVSATFAKKPEYLLNQLNDGGILLCPINSAIYKFVKKGETIKEEVYHGFAFVPMQEK